MTTLKTLPHSTAVLVLGICSLVFNCLFIGLIMGIIGIALSGKGRKMYKENPQMYMGYGALNAGFIMSIIGVVLGGLYTLYFLIVFAILGTVGFSFLHLF